MALQLRTNSSENVDSITVLGEAVGASEFELLRRNIKSMRWGLGGLRNERPWCLFILEFYVPVSTQSFFYSKGWSSRSRRS